MTHYEGSRLRRLLVRLALASVVVWFVFEAYRSLASIMARAANGTP